MKPWEKFTIQISFLFVFPSRSRAAAPQSSIHGPPPSSFILVGEKFRSRCIYSLHPFPECNWLIICNITFYIDISFIV